MGGTVAAEESQLRGASELFFYLYFPGDVWDNFKSSFQNTGSFWIEKFKVLTPPRLFA